MIPRGLADKLEEGEGLTLDFKFRLDSPIKTAQAMTAFANARGGSLLVGVRDDGSLRGVKAEEEWYAAEQAALVHCKPPLQPEALVWNAAGKEILEIRVQEAKAKPVTARLDDGTFAAFLREGDENKRAPGLMIYVWKAQQNPQNPLYRQEDLQWLKALGQAGATPLNKALRWLHHHRPTAMQITANFISQGVIAWEQREEGVFIWADDPKKARQA